MSIEQTLNERAGAICELCKSTEGLTVYSVPPEEAHSDKCILSCSSCESQLTKASEIDVNHWRCLNDSMWSPVAAVQVVSFRMLKTLAGLGEAWAQEQLDMIYMEEDVRNWAENDGSTESEEATLDSNNQPLASGDTVTLIKDLDVKGANFTAKRGTAVRNISLTNNPKHIEGRVNGQRIVIISAYVKKSN